MLTVYGMADYFFRTVPVVGTLWARAGGVAARPQNAYRLLKEQEQLALVFPEGTKGPSKSFTDRYQLRRFGRGLQPSANGSCSNSTTTEWCFVSAALSSTSQGPP